VIGAVNAAAGDRGVVVCAAGSLPGDLHKLWRARDPKSYHLEYGYSCMGYEVAGGLGAKMAAPDRDVFVMVGDGSWLMMSSELVTAVQEGVKLIVVLVDNHGYASIGGLSQSLGSGGFGTRLAPRVDFVANARSLGVDAAFARTVADLRGALDEARRTPRSTVIVIETDREARVPGYESWWDVPPAEVTGSDEVKAARRRYDEARRKRRFHL
jgi:3D-(3,5/4)-trihydroxycyclohexane-1,2-dione acylhydrolase (decyclizing)